MNERLVARVWRALPGYDRENIDEWLTAVVPVVLAGQRSSVALTEAFLAGHMDRQPLGVNADELIGAAVRNGVEPSEVYQRPFVTLWSALSEGAPYEAAAAMALARAQSTAAMDIQLSMRATAGAVQDADPGIYGYQRVANPGACAFCSEVDGAYVKSADAMPLHNHCGCGLEPLPDRIAHADAKYLPDGTQIRKYQHGPLLDTPTPPTVAVHEHGELGAVLASPDHNFTTAAQALA